MPPHVWDFLTKFTEELKKQLESDEERWGNAWLEYSPHNQEFYIFERINTYYDQWKFGKTPIPWLKIAGNAMIAWIRDSYPELWEK